MVPSDPHDDDLEAILLKYGPSVMFARQVADEKYQELWWSFTHFIPPANSHVYGPDGIRYRAIGVRSDISQHPKTGKNITHTIVLLFPAEPQVSCE